MRSIGNFFTGTIKANFNLTKQFALLSFFCILIIGTISNYLVCELITDKVLLRDATLSRDFIHSVIASEGTWQMFLDTPNSSNANWPNTATEWALDSFFSHVAMMPDVVRAKVYAKDRSVIWSSDPKELVGENIEANEELDASLKGELIFHSGVIGNDIKDEHKSLLDHKKKGTLFIETYIPIWNKAQSRVVAAVELYRAPRDLQESIIQSQRFIWTGSLCGGVLLFLSLYWIVNRAALVMANQQRRLIRAQSLSVIGQTASAITHAMRNPLSSIRACAEMSLTDDLEGVRESALEIMGETDRMDRWAREFLQFSVINTNSPEYLDLNDLVRTVLKEHETVLDRMAISVQLDMVAAQLPVNANASPLSQVLGNLIMNAVEAMGENGELKISTSLDSHCNHAVVSITDNGPGLLEEIKDKLFQPFATTKPTGTGLGLALSMHLVEHYSGILEILNEPGRGVTATVRLPLLGGPL